MHKLNLMFSKAIAASAVAMMILTTGVSASELEDESDNPIFHEVKGNLSIDQFYTSLGLYNGRFSTTIPVVSLPGNNNLPVNVYLQKHPQGKYTLPEPFALPMITGVLPCGYDEPIWRDWLEDLTESDQTNDGNNRENHTPHAGMYLNIPGMSPERMGLQGHTLGNFYFTCEDTYPGREIGGSPGRAPDFSMTITVHTPDGNKYIFDQMSDPDEVEFGAGTLYASSIEDAFGNTVTFTQTNGVISKISASDGREITFVHTGSNDSDTATTTISANNRNWVWRGRRSEPHKSITQWGANRTLTLPDTTKWTFTATNKTGIEPIEACDDQSGNIVITNPQGSTLTLTLTNKVVFSAFRAEGQSISLPSTSQYNCRDYSMSPYANQLRRKSEHGAVTKMSITVPRMSGSYNWNISYDQGWGREVPVTPSFPLTRTVSRPDGSSMVFTFESHSQSDLISTLLSTQIKEGSTVLATYKPKFKLSREVLRIHGDDRGAYTGGRALKEHQSLLESEVITIGSDSFTTTYSYDETGDWDKRNIATKVIRSSLHDDNDRFFDYEFKNLLPDTDGVYRIGLLTSAKRNGKTYYTHVYNGDGTLKSTEQFGANNKTSYSYYASGEIKTITNPVGRVDQFDKYKRGIPQEEIHALGTTEQIKITRIVDDNGWITSETDPNNKVISTKYDDLGRVTEIAFPGRSRETETRSYSSHSSGMITEITVGNNKTTITHDGWSRPVIVKREDLTGEADTIFENTAYDAYGRTVFSSLPSSVSAAAVEGVETTYDALGRVTSIKENVTPYAETTFRYLSGDRVEMKDPKGNFITTTFSGYYPLSQKEPIKYEHPESVTTTITRNIWGLQTAITQAGDWQGQAISATQNFYYDSYHRLCAKYTKETNYSLYRYDNAGQLTTYQAGASAGSNCPAPSGNDKVQFSYDKLGRIKLTNYTDTGTADISRTYDVNGNLKTLNRGGINWTYQYDDLNQLKVETLKVDGRTYAIGHSYNSYGFKTQQALPSGRIIDFSHNGFGDVIKVTSLGATYLKDVRFHENGMVSNMTYGNNQVFSQTLNARQMPKNIYSAKNNVKAIDLTYSYDSRRDVTSIIDGINGSNSKTLTYDDLGRLTSATGPWGAGSFNYDGLGNIRSKKLGNRNVTISYNSSNRVSQSTDTSAGTRSFGYDNRGNVTSAGNLSFVYDKQQQPIQLSGASNGTYAYDGNLKRVKSVVDGKTIYNVYDQSGALVHVDNRNSGKLTVCFNNCSDITLSKATDYVSANGATLLRVSNNIVTYQHPDLLGSPQSGSDAAGNIAWRESYTPYGEKWQKEAVNDDLAGFTGHISDSATGLTYMQARYYDPVIGRFYSNDPVDAPGHLSTSNGIHGFNRYAYANNNPYKFTDPTGMSSYNPQGMVKMLGGQEGIRQARQTAGKVADASTLKVGFGPGLQIKAQNVPGVGSFDAGGSVAVSSVMTSDPNAQGIEFSADAGLNVSNASGTMSGQLQLGKAEALVQPQNGTVSGKTEGAKITGTLSSSPTSVNNEGKVKVGAHLGPIKVELEVDTNKLDKRVLN